MRGFRLGSILGFEIRIDYSWFVIALLILWSLARGVFPQRLPGYSPDAYLLMGTVGALLFFASLLAHEISHSIVARARGVPVEGITLFVFGGMAHTSREAETPRDELVIAGVGPLCSVVLGLLFGLIWYVGGRAGWPVTVTGVAEYLALINLLLAGFNLLPGFPLDGGRLFRASVWHFTGDVEKATRWASRGGAILGYLLMGLGAVELLSGIVVGGLWLLFIGWFLRTAAIASFRQHLLSGLLTGVRAAQAMTPDPRTVAPATNLLDLFDRFLTEPHQAYPVVSDGTVQGLVTLDHLRGVPRELWATTSVREVMIPPTGLLVDAAQPLADVLEAMSASGSNRVLVARGGRLEGIISASDIARWVQKQQKLSEFTGEPHARR